MSSKYPVLPRQSVRDSFDEDDLSDVDDEVFIRDGKNGGLKLDDEGAVKRPLMAPRRKLKTSRANDASMFSRKALIVPFCYGLLALLVLVGLIAVCVYAINLLPVPLSILKNWLSETEIKLPDLAPKFVVPCTSLTSKVVWTRTLPKFTSEAPFRGNDVNGDKVEDIIVGFSTGLDAIDAPEYLCNLYFGGLKPCLGGIMALDGKSGDTIWIYWTAHAIFNVDCGIDITNDGVKDCLITGRGGIFHAVDASRGTEIWKFNPGDNADSSSDENVLDVYDVACMSDVDGDDVGDIVASHTVQTGDTRSSEIIVVSGKTGIILSRVDFPRKEELFVAPRSLLHPDGETMLVVVSSTPKKSGGLYVVSRDKLIQGSLQLHELYWGKGRGILLPPILIDVTSDGTEDIIVATVNATIAAFNGLTFEPIWNYTVPNSEVISIPIPGYYNDDEVPDFMVKHQIGPGYPLYYYTVATVLNGKNGTTLLEKPIIDSHSGQMSGLTISVDDFGNDWFLHWSSNCRNHEGSRDKYRFIHGQTLISQSRADICKLLYNTTLVTRLWALSQHVGPPGQSLYYSEDWKNVEYNNSLDPREQADDYETSNSDYPKRTFDSGFNSVSERSPSIVKEHRRTSNFRQKIFDPQNPSVTNDFWNKDEIPQTDVVVKNNYDDEFNDRYENSASSKTGENFRERKFDDYNSNVKSRNDDWNSPNDWHNDEIQRNEQLDSMYDDIDVDSRSSMMNDVREQRSDTQAAENIDSTENQTFDDKYDVDMDYTNGGSRYVDSTFNSWDSNDEEGTKKMLKSTKRRRLGKIGATRRSRRGDAMRRFDDEYANIENVFKRESMKNFMSDVASTNNRQKKYRGDENFVNRGVQRQPPTGILLSSLNSHSDKRKTVDLVFSTYWLPPSQVSLLLLQRDLDCISSKKSGDVDDLASDDVIAECLEQRGIDYKIYRESSSRENAKIPIGQMTVYRMELECACPDDMLPGMGCKNISREQSWSAHLGRSADGFFRPLRKTANV